MRRFLLFFCLLSAPLIALTSFPYLESPEGVRSSALGGAFGAVNGSAESQWYNPAGLSGLDGAELSFTHQDEDDGLSSDHIVLGAYLGWQQSLGLMYSSEGASDTYRDAFGNIGSSFQDQSSVLGLGYAYDLSWLSLGAEVKYLSESLATDSGSSTAFDVGAQGNIRGDQVLYGLSLQNLGSAPNLGGPAATPPTTLRASLGWRIGEVAQSLLLLSDYHYLISDGTGALALGAEYSEVYQDNALAIRAGWDFSQNQLGGISGLNLGAGYRYKFLGVDYTWSPMDALGYSQRIALTLTYDQRSQEREQNVSEFLQSNHALAVPLPTPTPRPRPQEKAHVGQELEALLAATPTPTWLPTPLIAAAAPEKPKGIFGAFFDIFSGGSGAKEEAHQGGILRGIFGFFGLSSSDEQQQALPQLPNEPGANNEDLFVTPVAQNAQGTPLPTPQPTPTLQDTPVINKMKSWLSF